MYKSQDSWRAASQKESMRVIERSHYSVQLGSDINWVNHLIDLKFWPGRVSE
jgi:hypothetical protein